MLFGKKKDTSDKDANNLPDDTRSGAPDAAQPDSLDVASSSQEAFSLDTNDTAADPIPFSDKDPEQREEDTATAQANLRKIREETESLIREAHPDIEREDTVDKAHERGEL